MFLIAQFTAEAAQEAVGNSWIQTGAGLAAFWALLRLIWTRYQDRMPEIISKIFERIPGFPGKELVVENLPAALKILFEYLLRQGVPAESASKIVSGVSAAAIPELVTAATTETTAELEKQMAATLKAAGK